MLTLRRLLIAVVLLLWGVATHSTYAGSGDEPHYLAIAHSIAFDFDLDLSNNYGASEPLIADGALMPGAHVQTGVRGIVRPLHDVGMPALFAPYVRIMAPLAAASIPHASSPLMRRLRLTPATLYRHLLTAVMILLSAWLAVVLAKTAADLGLPSRNAIAAALVIALSPPLLVMSLLFFTEVVSALVLLLAFRIVAATDRPTPRQWLLAGMLGGALLLVHVRNAGLIAGLLAVAIWRLGEQRDPRGATALVAGLLPLLAVRTFVNYTFWGSLVASPHARPGEWTGIDHVFEIVARRAAGLLVDQEYGLLPYSPIYALAPVGVILLWRRAPRATLAAILMGGAYTASILLPFTNVHGWTGGWSPAARFLTPVLPLAGLAVAAALAALPRALTVPLVLLQIGISAYFWQTPKNLWNDGDGRATVCSRGGYTFCEYLPSLVEPADYVRNR